MTLEAYHRALNQGFSESEAAQIADEAYEQQQYDEAQYAAEMEAEAQFWAEQEAIDEANQRAEPGQPAGEDLRRNYRKENACLVGFVQAV